MNGSLDANVILRIILNDLPEQRVQALKMLDQGYYHIADTAVVESAFVLQRNYHMDRQSIVQVLNGFLTRENLICNHHLFLQVFPMFVTHPALSFEDCCLAVYAELNKAVPLYTFDKNLAKQVAQAELVG